MPLILANLDFVAYLHSKKLSNNTKKAAKLDICLLVVIKCVKHILKYFFNFFTTL